MQNKQKQANTSEHRHNHAKIKQQSSQHMSKCIVKTIAKHAKQVKTSKTSKIKQTSNIVFRWILAESFRFIYNQLESGYGME